MSQGTQSVNTQQSAQREDPQNLLLQQYALYVKMADKVSDRRATTNTFYISLLTALLAFLSFVVEKHIFVALQNVLFLIVAIVGLILCIIWSMNILSYRKLNSSKFQVIQEMESHLPYLCYTREWEILKKEKAYVRLTQVERYIPFLFTIPYLLLLVYTLYTLLP